MNQHVAPGQGYTRPRNIEVLAQWRDTVPMSVLQGVINVLQHDIFNEHMPGMGLGYSARKMVLQSSHEGV